MNYPYKVGPLLAWGPNNTSYLNAVRIGGTATNISIRPVSHFLLEEIYIRGERSLRYRITCSSPELDTDYSIHSNHWKWQPIQTIHEGGTWADGTNTVNFFKPILIPASSTLHLTITNQTRDRNMVEIYLGGEEKSLYVSPFDGKLK